MASKILCAVALLSLVAGSRAATVTFINNCECPVDFEVFIDCPLDPRPATKRRPSLWPKEKLSFSCAVRGTGYWGFRGECKSVFNQYFQFANQPIYICSYNKEIIVNGPAAIPELVSDKLGFRMKPW